MNRRRRIWIWTAAISVAVAAIGAILVYLRFGGVRPVTFTEKDGLLLVRNDDYEAAFDATNGAFVSLKDRKTGETLSTGNRDGHLWWAILDDRSSLNSRASRSFSYEWRPSSRELKLRYDGPLKVDVTATFSKENRFTLQAVVRNTSDKTVESFRFPYELNLPTDRIRDALLPMLPGVKLSDRFFKDQNSFEDQYPGVLFASYVAVRTTGGSLALYDIRESAVKPVVLGFKNQIDQAGATGIVRDYKTWIAPQEQWTSPRIVVQVGGDYAQSIERYRTDNGIDRYRSLADKLGDRKDEFFASPFFKLDVAAARSDWSTLKSKWLDRLRHTGVIHLVAFQPGGHDENYPDFLPPDPRWGTENDFKQFIAYAREKGNLVVPYTNFSWWGVNAPTLRNLPSGVKLEDIVVRRKNGDLIKEDYGPHSGYVVNPGDPFVRTRIAEEHRRLLDAGVDGIFEDQWGIRNTPYVFGGSVPAGTDPSNAYIEALRQYSDSIRHPMYVEDGFDVLADDAVGFMGSVLLWNQLGYRPKTAAYTSYYPMMGMLARDKVMQFQHNLAKETMTMSRAVLRWNLAMGYHLSADLTGGTDNPWIDVVGVFQKHVLAAYSDRRIDGFEEPEPNRTVTRIGDMEITANWDDQNPLALDDLFTLAPGGVQTVSRDGRIRAGVYTVYNGRPLDGENHILAEIRERKAVAVYQPYGDDTTLAVRKEKGWKHAVAAAYRYDGGKIADLPVREEGDWIVFDYITDINGQKTGYVLLTPSDTPSAVGDVPFKKRAPMKNLALGRDVRSTSDTSRDYPAAKAVDGDPYTYWESVNRRFPQSLTVDLGEARDINLIRLKLPPMEAWQARDQEIEVLVSDDGEQFRTLLAPRNYRFDPNASNEVDIPLPTVVRTRYVRLTVTNNTGWPAAQIAELEVYFKSD